MIKAGSKYSPPQFIYKIISSQDWEDVRKSGVYRGSSKDIMDGFIHCSTVDQINQILLKYFKGQKNLLCLTIDTQKFNGDLRWETSPRSGQVYPHIYGYLSLQSVIKVEEIQDGTKNLD